MEASREEVEIPMPLNSAYPGSHVHGHVSNMFHQHHYHDEKSQTHLQVSSSNGPLMPITLNHDHHDYDHVRYRECMKNHAASMGGNVTDGCGEFMPSGGEGTIEALTCSVCNCHRNFHRKQVEGDEAKGLKVINLGHHKNMNMLLSPARVNGMVGVGGYPTTRAVPIIPYNMGSLMVCSDQSDGQDEGGGGGGGVPASGGSGYMGFPPPTSSQYHSSNQILKKRFRTKFTPEQKEKMFNFAEKIGWTIQKQEESAIQHFCQEIGVKRKVLKVWMHNNKHNLNKKNSPTANGGSEEKQP